MPRNRLIAVTLIAALMLLIVPLTVSAATTVADDKSSPASAETLGPNLLSNPGLEGHYQQQCSLKTDNPWVPAPTPCDPSDYDFVNRTLWATAQVPVGWAAWWRVPNDDQHDPNYFNTFPSYCNWDRKSTPSTCLPFHNPEFRDTAGGPQETGPSRRMEGENSQKYFTFYTVHDAGLYQIVANGVKKGDLLRFSVYMMAWSSTDNDPFHSVGQKSMGMQIGIDPYGSNNPWSPSIVWSPVKESWDTFSQFTVEAVAQGSMVSVWTRSQPTYAIQHNDVYVDAASLNVVSGRPAPRAAAPKTTTKVITTTKVVTGTNGVTRTVIVTSTINVPVSTATTKQVITSTKVVTSSTGVTSTVVTTKTITVPATSTVTTTKPATGTLPIPANGTYTVVRGDTLIAIARRFGITPWWKLGEINGLQEPYKIEVGQVLKLK
jgi:LysM repeat protein